MYFVCILHSCRIKDYLILKTSTQPFQKLNVSHETAPPTKNPTIQLWHEIEKDMLNELSGLNQEKNKHLSQICIHLANCQPQSHTFYNVL